MDSNLFRRACAQFATGVAVASAVDEHRQPHGLTINSFTSVSLDPPMVLICIDRTSSLLAIFEQAGRYGLSFLGEPQHSLSTRFAQRGQDRFDGVQWICGASGVPLIPGALAHLECKIARSVSAGDHDILIAEVVSADIQTGSPLLYYGSAYRRLE